MIPIPCFAIMIFFKDNLESSTRPKCFCSFTFGTTVLLRIVFKVFFIQGVDHGEQCFFIQGVDHGEQCFFIQGVDHGEQCFLSRGWITGNNVFYLIRNEIGYNIHKYFSKTCQLGS